MSDQSHPQADRVAEDAVAVLGLGEQRVAAGRPAGR